MNIIFCLLLISGLPALIYGTYQAEYAEERIQELLGNRTNLIDPSMGELVFLNGEKWLGATNYTLVKKGTYNGIVVAIKITWGRPYFDRELRAYEALNATGNEEIEKYGIPRIYYHGPLIAEYTALAMTPFEETVEDRYKKQGAPLSDLAVTLIMKQAVQILAYLTLHNVVHNDIEPDNIFLRGTEVFIADFGLAAVGNEQVNEGIDFYASSSHFAQRNRYAVDDLESLVYSMWHVAGIPLGDYTEANKYYPEGDMMFTCQLTGGVKKRIRQKCLHFKEFEVKHAFECIFLQEIAPRKNVPNYDNIITLLNATISEINKSSDKTTFEWLEEPPARRSFQFGAIFSKLRKRKR